MSNPPARRAAAAAALPILLAAGALACGGIPGPASPTAAPFPTQTATPAPTPRLLVLGVPEGDGLAGALLEWAQPQGWLVETNAADDEGLASGLAQPGVQAVVSLGLPPSLPNAFDGPAVVIEAPEAAVGAHLSLVGEPGARHDQVGFLAGVLTGLISRTERVGLLTDTGGAHEVVYRAAFDHGLRYGCPRCGLISLPAAQAAAQALQGQAVDAVFAVPGPAAPSALVPLAEAGLWVVWSGREPAPLPEAHLAGEIRMLPQALAVEALNSLLDGSPGQVWPYSVETQSIAAQSLNPQALSPGREQRLAEVWHSLAAGELEIGIDPATGSET